MYSGRHQAERRFAYLEAACAPARSVTGRLVVAGSGAGCVVAVLAARAGRQGLVSAGVAGACGS